MAFPLEVPGIEGDTIAQSPQKTPPFSKKEILEDVAEHFQFLKEQIDAMKTQTLTLAEAFKGYGESFMRSQLNLAKIYENLEVFIKNFSGKYQFGRMKIEDQEAVSLIALSQKWLEQYFEKVKTEIEDSIQKQFS